MVILALTAAIFAVYGQMLRHEFVIFDDDVVITGNSRIKDGLTKEAVLWSVTTTFANNWIPLTWLSHMADIELFGLSPWGHHLTNVLYHCANTALLFLLLWKMTGAPWRSTLVAALFALHPLHVESVAWATLRRDVLSTFLGLICLLLYRRYALSPDFKKYALFTLLFVMSLMAKPMLVTMPFLLLLLDYWPLGRVGKAGLPAPSGIPRAPTALVIEKAPLFALSALFSAVTFLAQRSGGAVQSVEVLPFPLRLANALVSYAAYIHKTLWPRRLAVLYPHPGVGLELWKTVAAGVMLLGITVIVLRLAVRRPALPVGWFWYLGTLVPVIGLVQVGSQAMADRYTYVPLIGLFVAAAWAIPGRNVSRGLNLAAGAACTVLLAALMVVSYFQVSHWRDSRRLMEHATQVTKDNYTAHNVLGIALRNQGLRKEAIDQYLEALRIKPDYASAHNNLGLELNALGRVPEAVRHYRQAIRIDPNIAEALYNLGTIHLKYGNFPEAAGLLSRALRLTPSDADTNAWLGTALLEMGQVNDALRLIETALRIAPNHTQARRMLARIRSGR